MNKFWAATVLLALFIFAGGCHLQNEEKSVREVWARRFCCDLLGEIIISDLEMSANSIDIKFCEDTIDRVYLSLTNIESARCAIKLDTMLDLPDGSLGLRDLNLFSEGDNSHCFINGKLRDGSYRLYLSTGNGCGDLYFRLLNGKFIPGKRICIENCVGNPY